MEDNKKSNIIKNYNLGKAQIIQKEFIADIETPISTLMKLSKNEKYSFLLESVEGGDQRGRYSLLGCDPDIIWEVKKNKVKIKSLNKNLDLSFLSNKPIESLKELINFSIIKRSSHDSPFPVLVGYLGYPMIQFMEEIILKNKDEINIPDALMIRPRLVAVYDNIKDTINVMTSIYPNKKISAMSAYKNADNYIDKAIKKLNKNLSNKLSNKNNIKHKLNFKSNYTKKEYFNIINKAKDYIVKGDIFQVVPSQRLKSDYNLSAQTLYRSLRRLNPSPFLVNLNLNNFGLVASSPEILVRLRENNITIRPIAGTRKRGKTINEDITLSKDLLNDEKEIAEHLMLLDLGRNDVGKVSNVNSVVVTEKFNVEKYSHVMHIVSNVEGSFNNKFSKFETLLSGFPAGTVSGAPKIRAMEIIDELENTRRKVYAGGIGYFSANGDFDTCIALRTAISKNNKFYIQSGAGIVADSKPLNEFNETVNKAKALIKALE